jgi:site-specific recombinase XerD
VKFAGMNREHVSRKFVHYVEKGKLEGFTLHSLRHTFVTNLVSAGVDIYTVNRLVGHSDIRTSLIYTKAKVDTLRDAAVKLEGAKTDGDKTVAAVAGS